MDLIFGNNSRNMNFIYSRLLLRSPLCVRKLLYSAARQILKRRLFSLRCPARLIFYVTHKCNLRCQHCFYSHKVSEASVKELSLYEIEQFCHQKSFKIKLLTITGGEPLTRNDIFDVCDIFLRNTQVQVISINTNGYFPEQTEKIVRKIITKYPRVSLNMQVSLDGFQETHNRLRKNAESFGRAQETILRLQKLYPKYKNFSKVSILTTVSRLNVGKILQFSEYVRNTFAILHKFQVVREQPEDTTFFSENVPSRDELKNFLEHSSCRASGDNALLKKLESNIWRHALRIVNNEKRELTCLAGRIDGIVYPDGMVALCEQGYMLGNLREFDYQFDKIWFSDKAERLRNEIKQNKCQCLNFCHMASSICFDAGTLKEIFQIH